MKETTGGGKAVSVITACIGAVLLVLAAAVACIEGVAFDRGFYTREYTKLGTAAYVGVDGGTLWEATGTLLDYLEGGGETLDMPVVIDGGEQEYYNEREKRHMADVAALNRNAVRFMIFGFVAGAALAAVSYMAIRKAYIMCKCAFFSIIGVLCGFGAIAVWAAADFNSFWINFHHVFFRNDLWVLDPAVSRMIRMFEQSFFFDMVALILALFISIVTASLLATGIAYKKLERRNA